MTLYTPRTTSTAVTGEQPQSDQENTEELMEDNTTLAPPEAFDTERSNAAVRAECGLTTRPEETGRQSRTVRNRIARSCAGWAEQPTTEEFHNALQAQEPTRRQQNLISMWMLEASNEDIILAWAEEAYTVRQLVAAVHRANAQDDNPARNAYLNSLSRG